MCNKEPWKPEAVVNEFVKNLILVILAFFILLFILASPLIDTYCNASSCGNLIILPLSESLAHIYKLYVFTRQYDFLIHVSYSEFLWNI